MKTSNPIPAAPVLVRVTATMSMIKTPAQKPVWKQFMVRKVPGFNASRRKRRIASASMRTTMTMKVIKAMDALLAVSACMRGWVQRHLRYSWSLDS
jgi:hypothetical protein